MSQQSPRSRPRNPSRNSHGMGQHSPTSHSREPMHGNRGSYGASQQPPRTHPRDPLHGIRLETIVEQLVARFGWAEMGRRIPINCFLQDPSLKSSLTFLRRTPWARQRVEKWYIEESQNKGTTTAEG